MLALVAFAVRAHAIAHHLILHYTITAPAILGAMRHNHRYYCRHKVIVGIKSQNYATLAQTAGDGSPEKQNTGDKSKNTQNHRPYVVRTSAHTSMMHHIHIDTSLLWQLATYNKSCQLFVVNCRLIYWCSLTIFPFNVLNSSKNFFASSGLGGIPCHL